METHVDMDALRALHLKYDGAIPQAELEAARCPDPHARRIAHCRAQKNYFLGTVRSTLDSIRKERARQTLGWQGIPEMARTVARLSDHLAWALLEWRRYNRAEWESRIAQSEDRKAKIRKAA